jgi:hypothetical protein
LRDKADAKILDSYNEERLENAENLLKTTDRFFNFVASPEPVLTYLRMHVFPYIAGVAFSIDAVKKFVFPRISQIGINYRHGSLSEHAGDDGIDVKAGDRLPYFQVDGRSIFDRLREPRFHLLTFADGKAEQRTEDLNGSFDSIVDRQTVPLYPHVAELFGVDKSFNVLLRPDNYIGLISQDPSFAPIEDYLKRCL